jgi:hypothetical protein
MREGDAPMKVSEKQLRSRARKAQEAEGKFHDAQAARDAAIIQAVAEGKTQTEVAGIVGVTKARVGRIVNGAMGATP